MYRVCTNILCRGYLVEGGREGRKVGGGKHWKNKTKSVFQDDSALHLSCSSDACDSSSLPSDPAEDIPEGHLWRAQWPSCPRVLWSRHCPFQRSSLHNKMLLQSLVWFLEFLEFLVYFVFQLISSFERFTFLHQNEYLMGLWATWSSWRCPCSLQGAWPLKVPSNPNLSAILWFLFLCKIETPVSCVDFSQVSSLSAELWGSLESSPSTGVQAGELIFQLNQFNRLLLPEGESPSHHLLPASKELFQRAKPQETALLIS